MMSGQVVVAADKTSRVDVERVLGPGSWTLLRDDRWVASYEVESEAVARKLVAHLRAVSYTHLTLPTILLV